MSSTTTTLAVQGMTCGGCARRVGDAARSVPGVQRADVDVAAGTLTLDAGAPAEEVRAAVAAAGYQVT